MRIALIGILAACVLAGCGSSVNAPVPTATPSFTPSRTPPTPATHPNPPPAPTPGPPPTTMPASAYTAVVRGTVTDARTGSPVPGATVSVGQGVAAARTDAFGRYRVRFPAGSLAPITVTVPAGFAGALALGKLRPHQTYTLNFKLNPISTGSPTMPSPPTHFGIP